MSSSNPGLGSNHPARYCPYLERRFGITAVKKGFITADQLIEALSIQVMEELEESGHRLIGEILFEKQYLTVAQIKELLMFLGISEKLIKS